MVGTRFSKDTIKYRVSAARGLYTQVTIQNELGHFSILCHGCMIAKTLLATRDGCLGKGDFGFLHLGCYMACDLACLMACDMACDIACGIACGIA